MPHPYVDRRKKFPVDHNEARRKDMMVRYLDNETMEEIGQFYGITRERVRQILGPDFIRAAKVGRKARVRWVCQQCGTVKKVNKTAAARLYCSRECSAIAARCPSEDYPHIPVALRRNSMDNRLWVRDPETGKHMRAIRYLAQKNAGRELKRTEFAYPKDGNWDNLTPENAGVRTASETARKRMKEHWHRYARMSSTYDRPTILAALKAFVEKHGDLPMTSEAGQANGLPTRITILHHLGEQSWPEAMENVTYILNLPNSRYRRQNAPE